MSRGAGFLNADLDTGFFHDAKVRRLARLHPDLAATAIAGYLGVLAGSWACGDRLAAIDAWPEVIPWSPEAVSALQDVELLDAEARIPEHAWQGWYGAAAGRRAARRAIAASGGHAKATNALLSAQRQQTDGMPTAQGQHAVGLPAVYPTAPTVPTDSPIPPVRRGHRNGSPRQNGTSPRAKGTAPRQVAQRRGMQAIGDVLREIVDRTQPNEGQGQVDPEEF